MRPHVLAVVLAAVLSAQCFGQPQSTKSQSLEAQVRAINAHSAVEVRLLDGSKLRGWIGEVSDTGFTLSHEQKRLLKNTQLPFDSVKAVKQVKSVKPGHTARNILIGVGIALAAVGTAVGVAVAHGLG